MIKKIGGFLEEHVEKIILIVIGLLCSWLLITRVLLSPNMVEYNNGEKTEKLSPSTIDNRINQDALDLKDNRRGSGEDPNIAPLQMPEFANLLASPLGNINTDIYLPLPENPGSEPREDLPYVLPYIGRLTDVDIEHIRAVVYEPISEVTGDNPYEDGNCEPNDLDLITVEAKFDIEGLYTRFYESFEDNVDLEFADPCLSKPIFASVDLQRQERNKDGSWSEWAHVPRLRIDQNRNLFKVVESSSDLPRGGIKIYKLQLDNKEAQVELLQPQAYQIASADEEWFPPNLHRDYLSAQKKVENEEKRAERQERANDRASNTDGTRRGRTDRAAGGQLGVGGTIGTNTNTGGRTGRTPRGTRGNTTTTLGTTTNTGRRRGGTTQPDIATTVTGGAYGQEETAIDEVYDDFEEILLTIDTDLRKMDEPLVIWAHDDTASPGKTYRYQMRLGVLNPIAAENSKDIILWSDFSEVTDSVEIPQRIYFFANNIRETSKTVTVSIYKYSLGYWYKEDFPVAPGEMIGEVVEYEPEEDENATITGDEEEEPEIVDYSTGAIMVDVAATYEWSESPGGSLERKQYHDMMYSYDGMDVRHIPVTTNRRNLPLDLRIALTGVQTKVGEIREPFKDFGSNERQIQLLRSGQYRGMLQ